MPNAQHRQSAHEEEQHGDKDHQDFRDAFKATVHGNKIDQHVDEKDDDAEDDEKDDEGDQRFYHGYPLSWVIALAKGLRREADTERHTQTLRT